MSVEKTLSIIKPDATIKNVMGKIIDRFESSGLKVVAGKLIQMDGAKAAGFYAEHKERPFFPSLVEYMTSAPVFVQVLEGENAVLKNRELMGATNPVKRSRELSELILLRPLMLMLYMAPIQLKVPQGRSATFLKIAKSFS